jgi:UDP-glucose 4-epimerase
MRILVLGGCGFIGSHVTERLLANGHDVSVFARRNVDRSNISLVQDRIRMCTGDFMNDDDVRRAVVGMEVVVHLIGSTLPAGSVANPTFELEVNVVPSVNLFSACVDAGVKKIVFVSSGGTVYGTPLADAITESHPLDPINPYGVSKLAIEKFLGVFRNHYGIDYTVMRLSNPYGRRQNPRSGQGVIAAWMHRIQNGNPVEIWGDGQIVRDYLAVEDAAHAIELACTHSSESRVFNVGSGKGYPLAQILRILEQVAGYPVPVVRKEARRADVHRSVLDVTLIERELGWTAKVPLEEGIRLMWEQTTTAPNGIPFRPLP